MPEDISHQRNLTITQHRRCIDLLTENWPYLFEEGNVKPLTYNIHTELIADINARKLNISCASLLWSLHAWKSREQYLLAKIKGGPRYGLHGAEGEIPETVREFALYRLCQLYESRSERLLAQREPDSTLQGE